MPQTTIDKLDFDVQLERYSMGPADELGTRNFWNGLLWELWQQMNFTGVYKGLRLCIYHMDHPEQTKRVAEKRICLKDLVPSTPAYEGGAGLYEWSGELGVAVYPDNYTDVYSGPARPITAGNVSRASGVISHEFGHNYFARSRYGENSDDVARLQTANYNKYRSFQADNVHENGAEDFKVICGTVAQRGKFSDGKAYTPSPELYATIRCLFWLAGNLKSAWVPNLKPINGGVMYQAWFGLGFEWRFVSAYDFKQQKYNGSTWVNI
jgi:hypothetical protein